MKSRIGVLPVCNGICRSGRAIQAESIGKLRLSSLVGRQISRGRRQRTGIGVVGRGKALLQRRQRLIDAGRDAGVLRVGSILRVYIGKERVKTSPWGQSSSI